MQNVFFNLQNCNIKKFPEFQNQKVLQIGFFYKKTDFHKYLHLRDSIMSTKTH